VQNLISVLYIYYDRGKCNFNNKTPGTREQDSLAGIPVALLAAANNNNFHWDIISMYPNVGVAALSMRSDACCPVNRD
jgi:hypothetical protein